MIISQEGRKSLIFGVHNGLPSDEEAAEILASLRGDPNAREKICDSFLRVTAAILRHLMDQE